MSESVKIQAQDKRAVFIDQFDGDIWLSVQTSGSNSYCVIPKEQAQKMVDTLIHFLAQEVTE
jgi:hypothetical protein